MHVLTKLDDQHYTYDDYYHFDWQNQIYTMWHSPMLSSKQVVAWYYCLPDHPGECVVRLHQTIQTNPNNPTRDNIAEIVFRPEESTMTVCRMLKSHAGTNTMLLAMSAAWQVIVKLAGRPEFVWFDSLGLSNQLAGKAELLDKPDWPRYMSRLPPKGVRADDLDNAFARHDAANVQVFGI